VTLTPTPSVYNQERLDDETFCRLFVARQDRLEQLLSGLRHAAAGGEAEHQVVVGARGMGKTSLLRRVAIAIGEEEGLAAAFLPLRFREEQYNVISLDAFWRNCGEALAQWCEENGRQSEADALDEAIESPQWRNSEEAARAFLAVCDRIGRRACLLVDNLDLILGSLSDQEGWALRNDLQKANGPCIIGAATHFLEQAGQRNAPFYEFFHPLELEPLTEAELVHSMQIFAAGRGEAGARVTALLATGPERIRTLYNLTGGNPRILVLIYQLLERADSDTIFGDLEVLLDQVTPFYKARVEEYQTPQQRAIIDGIALNWDPITSSSLSRITGVEVTTISSQLNRLQRDGFVERVPTSGARDGYQLAERFLNIWYLMRHGTRKTKQRLRWLTLFLTKLFSTDELARMAAEVRHSANIGRFHPDYCVALAEAYEQVAAFGGRGLQAGVVDGLRRAPTNGKSAVKGLTNGEARVGRLKALLSKANEDFKRGDFEPALAGYTQLVDLADGEGDDEVRRHLVVGLFNQGLTNSRLNEPEAALRSYSDLLTRFGQNTDSWNKRIIAAAMVTKANTLVERGRIGEGAELFEEVVRRFRGSDDPSLRMSIARAMAGEGAALGNAGRPSEALAAFDDALLALDGLESANVRKSIAVLLLNKALALQDCERWNEEVSVCDELLDRFGTSHDAALENEVGKALANKGVALDRLKRWDEALAVYDQLVAHESLRPGTKRRLAEALVNKGITLTALGRPVEAVDVFDEAIALAASEGDTLLREQRARAFAAKGDALRALDRDEEAIALFREAAATLRSDKSPLAKETLAGALLGEAESLQRLGRNEFAMARYDDLLNHCRQFSTSFVKLVVARALMGKASLLRSLNRRTEAVGVYEDVVHRFVADEELDLQEVVATALGEIARIKLERFGRYAEAEEGFRRGLDIKDSLFLRSNLLWALIAQAKTDEAELVLTQSNDIEQAGRDLARAGLQFIQDNLGSGTVALGSVLDQGLEEGGSIHFEDLLWLLRIAADRGHGERLIEWFNESGHGDRYLPIFAAFVAYVRGEQFLLDINPEARKTAQTFYDRLSAPRRYREGAVPDGGSGRKRAGRPKRRRGR
jgi:tetratricopeptide (TPR) repeat protein